MMLEIFITIFLVLLNGFFVAAEFAIVKVRYSQIQIKAEQGNRFAKKSEHIINNLDTYLSATQLGITLASLGLGWIGEPVVSKIISTILVYLGVEISPETLHSISLPVGFLVITVLHIVFGELAPKSIAIRKPEKATLFVAYPLEWFFYAFKPFIWLMNSISNGFLSLIGIKPIGEHEIHSTEELKILVQQSKDGGAIQDENYEIIKNAFDFTDHKAKQIMVPRQQVFAFDIKLSVEEIIEEIYKIGYSRIPVYENSIDNIIGVLYSKEVLKSYYKNPDFKINELLHKVHYVFESKRISEILTEFQKLHIHLAVIIDEFGGTQGIITLEDIIEELVGEIQDEDDDEKPIVEKKDDETYIIQATQSLADINEFLKYPFKLSENYQTLAGLLLSKLNRVPKVDEKIVYENYELTILKLQRGTIQSVQLKNIKPNINKLIEIIKLDKK